MSSEIFPFFSKYNYDISLFDDILKTIGEYIKINNMRVTFHPGEFNILNSTKDQVVLNTINDLNCHCIILEKMGLDNNSVLVLHGGVKNRLQELKENLQKLPENIKNRIVLENDEIHYTVEDRSKTSYFSFFFFTFYFQEKSLRVGKCL